jgi:iron complex transport system ATP-binding protein
VRAILELREVSFRYPSAPRPVLRRLSLRLQEGSVAAVLGPNGAGKSTLLDLCLGWRAPSSGEVLLAGRPLASLGRRERGRLVSLVPQQENVRFDFSVLDYVMLGRAPHLDPLSTPGDRDRAAAREALRATGMQRFAHRPITTLSGGEYQLMLLARSLAQEPAVLLLDEPAAQLDPANQLRVARLLRELAGRGIAVLYTSHNPQAAAQSADVIHLLHYGALRASGPPRQVLSERTLREVYGVAVQISWRGHSPAIIWGSGRDHVDSAQRAVHSGGGGRVRRKGKPFSS